MQTHLLQLPSDFARNAGRSNRLPFLEDPPLLQRSLQDLASVLQNCSTKKDALYAHTFICNCGLEADAQLGPLLISSFVASNGIHYSQQIFDKLTYRTECSWEKLISAYYKLEKPHEALSLYNKMLSDAAVQPTSQTFIVLLQCCAKLKELEKGFELHAEVCKAGLLDGNLSMGSILVHMYGRCNSLAKAQQVLDKFYIRDVVIWTALMFAYSEHGSRNDTLRCFKQMKCEGIFPNAFTFASILKGGSGSGLGNELGKLHVEIEWLGLVEKDIVIGNCLIDNYGKSGMLGTALFVFDRLPTRNVVSWTILMSVFVDNEQYEEVLSFYKQMILEGLSINPVTVVSYLGACGGSRATCEGQEMHMEIEKKGWLESNSFIGSSLVDFYAKMGMIWEAKYIFDMLRAHDSITWTALIGGYFQHGHSAEALMCFDKMQHCGALPTVVTFSFVLEVCKHVGAEERGEKLHAEIERLGLLCESFHLGNSLIDMYFQFCMPARGQEVFDHLLCRNVVSWNTLITGYAESGHDKKVMLLYNDMKCQQVFPNAITFYCVLKSCGRLDAIDMGQIVHTEIEKLELVEKEGIVGEALVEMYGRFGLVEFARKLFDNLRARDVSSWTALIAGYSQHKHNKDVLKCLEQMQSDGISPSEAILGCCLQACGELGAFKTGYEVHAEIERQCLLEADDGIGNSLVNMYVKWGLVRFAEEVVCRLSGQNLASAKVSLAACMGHVGKKEGFEYEEVFECRKSLTHDINSFASNLMACKNVGVIDADLHVEIERKGLLEKDIYIGNVLMGMYIEHGELVKVQEVFDSLLVQDIVSWNVLISGYMGQRLFVEVLDCFKRLTCLGVYPDPVTYLFLLRTCSRMGDVRTGDSIFMELEKLDLIGRNFGIGSALMNMYMKCGLLEKAEQVFNRFSARSFVLWNVLMRGYADYGNAEETLKCFEEMQLEGYHPNASTYLSCLRACSITGAINEGTKLHVEVGRMDLLKHSFIGNSLIDMYAKCGQLCKAREVFDSILVHDVFSYTSLITGYARCGESENIFSTFDSMIRNSIEPDPIIFLAMLTACKQASLVDKSLSYFELMSKDHGIDPSLDHNKCVIDMLGRAGRLDLAIELVRRMPISPNLELWDALLGCCRYWGEKKFGKIAFQHALQLNEKDAMAYVLMSHIQGDADLESANTSEP